MTARPMTGPELAQALRRLGFSHGSFAAWLSRYGWRPVSRVTVAGWCQPDDNTARYARHVPAATAALVWHLLAQAGAADEIGGEASIVVSDEGRRPT